MDALRRPQAHTFRERRDVLKTFNNADLIKRYGLDWDGILYVTDLVLGAISPPTALMAEIKVIGT